MRRTGLFLVAGRGISRAASLSLLFLPQMKDDPGATGRSRPVAPGFSDFFLTETVRLAGSADLLQLHHRVDQHLLGDGVGPDLDVDARQRLFP